MGTHTLAVILARAGSKGLPGKNTRSLAGRPMIGYTIEQALESERVDAVCVTTDAPRAAATARELDVLVIDRPPALATDTATVDAAVRHAVGCYERDQPAVTHVAILYANVPLRPPGIVDRALRHLLDTGADSVRTLRRVTKQHPDWLHRLDGDRMVQFRKNAIYRRQDLEPLYYHDGAVVAVTRASLFKTSPDDHHAFLGGDRRGIVHEDGVTVDVDSPADFALAEALISKSREGILGPASKPTLSAHPTVTLGSRPVGADHPVYVIAEAGVNHNGDAAVAHDLIEAAHRAGADAVKFQWFTADRLVAASAPTCDYQKEHDGSAATQRDMLRRLELDAAVFAELKSHADRIGIDFLATPFGIAELDQLLKLDVPAIKIASSDLVNVPLLTAAARSGRTLIVSTGASTHGEIDQAVQLVRRHAPKERLILFHCVSAYPTQPTAARLRRVRALADRYHVPVGFSDHTPEATFSSLAVASGATIIEKHLTLDRGAAGPDHFFSLEPADFARYVAAAHHARSILGDGAVEITPQEQEIRRLARGSITAAADIPAGQVLAADMLAVRRPGTGLAPALWEEIIGRTAKTDIPADTPLAMSMLK